MKKVCYVLVFIAILCLYAIMVYKSENKGVENLVTINDTDIEQIQPSTDISANDATPKSHLVKKTKKQSIPINSKITVKKEELKPLDSTDKPEKEPAVEKKVEPVITEGEKPKKKNIFTYDIKKFASDSELVEALTMLENCEDETFVKNIQKYSMRIKFDDFSNVLYKRDSYFAMSAYKQNGTRYILVNSMYKNSPPEQLACIIAHESMHTKVTPTLEEETLAVKKEAACWNSLRSYTKAYPDTKLTARLNKLADNKFEEIEKQIANTSVYREQFEK